MVTLLDSITKGRHTNPRIVHIYTAIVIPPTKGTKVNSMFLFFSFFFKLNEIEKGKP